MFSLRQVTRRSPTGYMETIRPTPSCFLTHPLLFFFQMGKGDREEESKPWSIFCFHLKLPGGGSCLTCTCKHLTQTRPRALGWPACTSLRSHRLALPLGPDFMTQKTQTHRWEAGLALRVLGIPPAMASALCPLHQIYTQLQRGSLQKQCVKGTNKGAPNTVLPNWDWRECRTKSEFCHQSANLRQFTYSSSAFWSSLQTWSDIKT